MKRPLLLLAAAAAWITGCGLLFSATQHAGTIAGVYWATVTATTVGYGDVIPRGTAGQLLAMGVMLTAIPLLGAVFTLIASAHLSGKIREHVDARLAEHHQAIHDRLDRIEGKGSPLTGTINMYDTIDNSQFPPDCEAYAAYVDGGVGDQPNYGYVVSEFPKASHLSIAVFASDDAEAIDVETGAAPPTAVPGWYSRQKARGIARPVFYANASTMEGFVLPVMTAAAIPRPGVRLWSAHYDGEHICGPSSCGQVSIAMDGTQWTNSALGRVLDQSLLLSDFFAAPAPPKPPADWVFGKPQTLRVTPGHTNFHATWSEPAGAPEKPAFYLAWVYEGTDCTVGTLVKSYPRHEAGTVTSPDPGSLKEHTEYTLHVSAFGAGATRAAPDVYASVQFTTG